MLNQTMVLDRYYLESRCNILELAAMLDRYDRAGNTSDGKESENITLARQVLAAITPFLEKPTVLGFGEIGLNKNTPNEMVIFQEQMDLAIRHHQLVLIHTPHLRDKRLGTKN